MCNVQTTAGGTHGALLALLLLIHDVSGRVVGSRLAVEAVEARRDRGNGVEAGGSVSRGSVFGQGRTVDGVDKKLCDGHKGGEGVVGRRARAGSLGASGDGLTLLPVMQRRQWARSRRRSRLDAAQEDALSVMDRRRWLQSRV